MWVNGCGLMWWVNVVGGLMVSWELTRKPMGTFALGHCRKCLWVEIKLKLYEKYYENIFYKDMIIYSILKQIIRNHNIDEI